MHVAPNTSPEGGDALRRPHSEAKVDHRLAVPDDVRWASSAPPPLAGDHRVLLAAAPPALAPVVGSSGARGRGRVPHRGTEATTNILY